MILFITNGMMRMMIPLVIGCPECAKKCNVELKEKLKTALPTIPHKKIDEALANENGVFKLNIHIVLHSLLLYKA